MERPLAYRFENKILSAKVMIDDTAIHDIRCHIILSLFALRIFAISARMACQKTMEWCVLTTATAQGVCLVVALAEARGTLGYGDCQSGRFRRAEDSQCGIMTGNVLILN